MNETILRDGEIAFLVNGVEIIMNDNTLLGLLEKLNLIKTPAKKDDLEFDALAALKAKLETIEAKQSEPVCPPCPYHDGKCAYELQTKPVAVFEYDKKQVDKTGNRYAGFVRRIKWFESAQDAEAFYGISKGRVGAIARTWANIIRNTWDKKKANKYQHASAVEYCGRDEWGTPYSFTATDCDGNTLAFAYIEDLPQTGFLV